MPPAVSVILPTHRTGAALERAVASVLAQSFSDLELLLVEDGCEADLAASPSFADPRLRVLRHEINRGPAAARNTGIAEARGAMLAFLDSDDVWLGKKLERQLAWMASKSPSARISATGFRIQSPFHPRGEERVTGPSVSFDDLLWGCRIPPSTLVAEKSLLGEVGPFDEALRRLEDWDWLLRCARMTQIAAMPEVLTEYRTSARETYPLKDVQDAATTIVRYVAEGRYQLTPRQRRTVLAAAQQEIAAAAFRRRHYGTALAFALRSICRKPVRPLGSYRGMMRAARSDLASRRAGKA